MISWKRCSVLTGLLALTISTASAQQALTVDQLADLLTPKIEQQPASERTRSFRPNDATRGISTIAPSQVPVPSQVVSLKVEFDTGSATLRPDGKAELDKLALSMNKVKQVVRTRSVGQQRLLLSMVGHTDHRGGEEYNQRLSEQRAEAARRYLKEYWGYTDAEFEVVTGRGKAHPVDRSLPCDDICMQMNRRVEVQTSLR